MRWSLHRLASSARSAPQAKSISPTMHGSSIASERPSLPVSGIAMYTSQSGYGSAQALSRPARLRTYAGDARWGFTAVWDLGSDPRDSLALRRRVNSGEIPGPTMLLAGDIFPKGGHPAYLPADMQLPE